MSFNTFLLKLKFQETKLNHTSEKIRALIQAPEVTIDIVHEIEAYNAQLENIEVAVNSLFDNLLQENPQPEGFDEGILTSKHGNFSTLLSDTRCKTTSFLTKHVVQYQPATADGKHTTNVRLPKINLPSFSGQWDEWPTFGQLFQATIHENPTLSDIEKFQYLVSCLKGEAFQVTKNLPLTAENYSVAWELLTHRYQNSRKLATLYINRILDLHSVNSMHPKSVLQFVNTFLENARALEGLAHFVTKNNPILVTILLKKLDLSLRTKFENSRPAEASESFPEVEELVKFLQLEAARLESAHDVGLKGSSPAARSPSVGTVNKTVLISNPLPSSTKCLCCKQMSHTIYRCPEFLAKSTSEREQVVRSKRLCFNCLGAAHMVVNCASQHSCSQCQQKHHTLLHHEQTSNEASAESQILPPVSIDADIPSHNSTFVGISARQSGRTTILLSTTMVRIQDSNSQFHTCRAVLDSAAQGNFITDSLVQRLCLSRHRSIDQVSGLSQCNVPVCGRVRTIIAPIGNSSSTPVSLLVVPKISHALPPTRVDVSIRQKVSSLHLADPTFDTPGLVDIILGAEVFAQILVGGKISLGKGLPVALETDFGWILMGQCPEAVSSPSARQDIVPTALLCISSLDSTLKKFWELEEPPCSKLHSPEDVMCENHYVETHFRLPSGRYGVRLPFRQNVAPDPSRMVAESRFKSLERRFMSQPDLRNMYGSVMEEYISLQHMELYLADKATNQNSYYIPHHEVLKSTSSTTKLRVVFDASAKLPHGKSLNDCLFSGPKLQANIIDIICKFRVHAVVLCCDVKQMYRQIIVHPEDRHYQLILWRPEPALDLHVYQLNTVTFGVTCSPFLAIRTLQQLAQDEGSLFPRAAEVLLTETFVDDIITGAATVDEARALQRELIELLGKGCFELRKWVTNKPELLKGLPQADCETLTFRDASESCGILGMQWHVTDDSFSYQVDSKIVANSKRSILSCIARLFDPLGWLSPIVMWAKVFMQFLWLQGLAWDDPLPSPLFNEWHQFSSVLTAVNLLSIPRPFTHLHVLDVQLHGFSDASEKGYAAVVYLRSLNSDQSITISIVIAKTKVAPLKRVSVPRLELCGAHLLSKLLSHIHQLLIQSYAGLSVYAWSDSSVALSWIRSPPHRLKTYVANRVTQIQEWTSPDMWHHVHSEDNPADCASRGLLPNQLTPDHMWWQGPSWLALPLEHWPHHDLSPVSLNDLPDVKPLSTTALIVTDPSILSRFEKFTSWTKLQRTVAWIIRLMHKARGMEVSTGSLTLAEINQATHRICWVVQHASFGKEIDLLQNNKPCPRRIQHLLPFIDSKGLVRAGGRLTHSQLPDSMKHPIILPNETPIVKLLINHYHLAFLHAGPQLLQAMLAQRFWILSARSLIRSCIHACVTCFRCKPQTTPQLMGDLPPARVTPNPPFTCTGVDFTGFYTIRLSKLRKAPTQKAYICLFICFSTKAVHLEVVSDLTAEAFLAALSRFVARRGLCSDLYADCGTNFIGAAAHLRKTFQTFLNSARTREAIQTFALAHHINFHFNPPAAPHQGGLWEAAVKSAKTVVKKVMGNQILTFEELTTVVTRVEAALNSRPLTPMSNDPADLSVLTPGHFLIGKPLLSYPEEDFTHDAMGHLQRWKLVQAISQHFWRRWHREYLHTLQSRGKWTIRQRNIVPGDLVLVHQDHVPPLSWCLARVVEVFPGKDNLVRVAKIRTANGELVRPTSKLYLLPSETVQD